MIDLSETIAQSGSGRNYYAEFMESSRWLRKEQSEARSQWFSGLQVPVPELALFRFEMLLKGLVNFGNPRNHPGASRSLETTVERSWSVEMELLLSTLRSIVTEGRALLGKEDASRNFAKYIDSVAMGDQMRIQLVRNSLQQDTPAESLLLLVDVMENLSHVCEGLLFSGNVSYELFSSIALLTQREIHRSEFFNPLSSFEFRSEFDAIDNEHVVSILGSIESETSQRVAAITFLSMFRLLHYLDIALTEDTSKTGFGPLFSYLALLHSDGLEFSVFFIKESATWMAEGFEREYQHLPPLEVIRRFDELNMEFEHLKSLKELLASTGNQLRLEIKKVFEQQLPAISEVQDPAVLNESVTLTCQSLRSFLQNAIVLIVREFSANIDGNALFTDFTSDAVRSERLRRDVWMFQQILRAFIAKSKGSAGATDRWGSTETFQYVQTFVQYFRSMGYQLLRYSDYAHFDRFMMLVDRLRERDSLEVQQLPAVISECEDFHHYLEEMFKQVSHREELKQTPFDKRDATATLKLFLGA